MAKLFDENGNEVEGALTKEDHETALATGKTEAVEAYKTEHPEEKPETPEEKADREKKEAELAAAKTPEQIAEEVAGKAVANALRARDISDMAKRYAPGDAEKQKEIIENAGHLQGYEENSEGLGKQMEAAASMAGIDVSGVNVADVSHTGSGRNVDVAGAAKMSEADKTMQNILKITPEDVKKYGPEVEKTLGAAPVTTE